MAKQARQTTGVPDPGRRGARKALPTVLTLCLALAALIYFTAAPLLSNFEPMFYRLTSALSFSKSGFVIYLSENTTAHFRAVGGNYETLASPWKNYFAAHKIPVATVTDLKNLSATSQTTLILPSAVSLDAHEREQILAFYNRGGSVLSTWATGTWSAPGQWAGWDFLSSLGGNILGDSATSASKFLLVRGETPVSFSVAAGTRISLSPAAEKILLFKADESSAGRLVNWDRLADPAFRDKNSIVQFSESPGKQGRVVLFGFSENAWANTPDRIYPLIDDCLSWLMRRPVIVRAAWPNAYTAAQVLEMDTEEGFASAEELAALARGKDIPVSFFVLTSVAKKYPEVLRRLSEHHEIAYHGDVHEGFKGQPAALQTKRIQAMQADVRELLGPNPERTGFRPPNEEYDATTQAVLQDNGIRYEVVDPNSTDGRLPFMPRPINPDPEKSLIALPRTQRDDLNLLSASTDPVVIEKALIEDLDVVAESGGLAVLSVHSQNFTPDSPLARAMPYYLSYLNTLRSQIWLTDTGSVAQWWRARSRVSLSSITRGDNVELNMTVSGQGRIEQLALIVMTPELGAAPRIAPLKVGMPAATTEMMDPLRYRINFPALMPGNYSYQVTFRAAQE